MVAISRWKKQTFEKLLPFEREFFANCLSECSSNSHINVAMALKDMFMPTSF